MEDNIRSRPYSEEGRINYDEIFRKAPLMKFQCKNCLRIEEKEAKISDGCCKICGGRLEIYEETKQ